MLFDLVAASGKNSNKYLYKNGTMYEPFLSGFGNSLIHVNNSDDGLAVTNTAQGNESYTYSLDTADFSAFNYLYIKFGIMSSYAEFALGTQMTSNVQYMNGPALLWGVNATDNAFIRVNISSIIGENRIYFSTGYIDENTSLVVPGCYIKEMFLSNKILDATEVTATYVPYEDTGAQG